MEFAPFAHYHGHGPEKSNAPIDVTITAGTVGEFFQVYENVINAFLKVDAYEKHNAQYADSVHFKIDPTIAASTIIYNSQIPMSSTNPSTTTIDTSKGSFSIKVGTSVLAVVDRCMALSGFLIGQLKDVKSDSGSTIQNSIFNAYKTTVSVQVAGTDVGDNLLPNVWDNIRNTLPISITYNISQNPNWKGEHPSAPTTVDSTPYNIKKYNYLYTGKNIDIIDLFDKVFKFYISNENLSISKDYVKYYNNQLY